ncbi:hypothetical protein Tco_0201356 [Tanacetum coccineum]
MSIQSRLHPSREKGKSKSFTEKVVEDKSSGDKGGNAEELVSTAIDAARQEDSTVEPRTPPTTTSIFDDEDIIMAQTLIKMKEEKAKEKGVSIKDVDDSSRPERSILTLKPLPTIDPKDKGKGVLKESPVKKVKRSDFNVVQIARDAEIARQLQVDLQAEVERERQREEEASKAAIAEMYDEVQAGIDADALAAQRSAKIRSRPPTKSQLRNLMMTYLKNMDDAVKDSKEAAGVHKQKVLEEPNNTKVEVKQEGHEESIRKRPGRRLKMKATKKSKRQKTDADLEEKTKSFSEDKRKYPLTKETLERMLSLRLVAGTASEDAYTLLRFIQKQIDEYGSHDGGEKDL